MSTELWDRFLAGDQEARGTLIEQYVPMVRYVVGRMRLTLPPSLDFEDIVGFGTLGLIEAVERFEPERGFKFGTYAIQRIRGAILDELRALDWAPRRVRARMRNLDRAASTLNGRLQRDASTAELAAEMGIEETEVLRILREADETLTVSLDRPYGDEDGATVADVVANNDSPLDDVAMSENLHLIARGVEALDSSARALMALYYFEGMTFTQIGDLLGVTESWVCQVHADAMRRVRMEAVL